MNELEEKLGKLRIFQTLQVENKKLKDTNYAVNRKNENQVTGKSGSTWNKVNYKTSVDYFVKTTK